MLMTIQSLLLQFGALFAINFTTAFIIIYCIYYTRHHDKQTFVTYMLFNIFLFTVVFFLIRNDAVISLWFAIFGILSLLRLRSETFSRTEITYFFVSMSIALLNGMAWIEYIIVMITVNALLVWAVYLFDHPKLFDHPQQKILYKLDSIPANLFADKEETKWMLSALLNITITDYQVIEVNSIKDSTDLRLTFKK